MEGSSMHTVTITLHLVGEEPLTTEVGVLNNKRDALSCFVRMVRAGELVCWKEVPGQSLAMKEAERKEREKEAARVEKKRNQKERAKIRKAYRERMAEEERRKQDAEDLGES